MLVLTRKPTQVIRIGSEIVITVVKVRGGQVRLGVSAPKELAVHRQEVYEKANQMLQPSGNPNA